ncbi:MAG: hypothetical protein ACJA1C_002300 [Crocinitomicaceae bacterium]|jgi:hypothetical protein
MTSEIVIYCDQYPNFRAFGKKFIKIKKVALYLMQLSYLINHYSLWNWSDTLESFNRILFIVSQFYQNRSLHINR